MNGMNIPMMRSVAGSIDNLERVADGLDADMSDLRAGHGLTRRDCRRLRREYQIPNGRTAGEIAAAAYLRAGATDAAVDMAHGKREAFSAATDAMAGTGTTDAARGGTDALADVPDWMPSTVITFEGYDPDDPEQVDALARFAEQFGATFETAETDGDEQTETTDHDDETDETTTMQTTDFSDESEELAEAVLRADDIRESNAKNLTAAEYLAGKYRLDAAEYDDRYKLRRHLTDAKNDIPTAEQTVDAKPTAADGHLADFAEQMETGSASGDPTAADKLAKDHMIIGELRGAIDAGRSPAEHLAAEYDIDTDEYVGADHGEHDDDGLHEALADARSRVDMTGLSGNRGGRGGHSTDMSGESEPLSPSNPGGVGEPHGPKGPARPGNKNVSPARFAEHGETDGEGGEGGE